jgi:hypothetical protein
MQRTAWLYGAMAACLFAACDGGDTPPDGGRDGGDDAETDSGPVESCEGAADGTPCAGGMICLGESCTASTCGDDFVDTAGGEQCEDGNTDAFDGCEPDDCTFTCDGPEDCIDSVVCDGSEVCTSGHVCAEGAPASDGTPCETDDGANGVCRPLPSPVCLVAECGNRVRDTDEACDDGRNGDASDGCADDCRLACASTTEGCQLVMIPDFHDFGMLEEGMTLERTFTLQNASLTAGTAAVPSVSIAGLDETEFEIVSDDCEAMLAPFGTCTFTVRFAPSGAGMRQAMITASAGAGFEGAAEVRGVALGALGTECTGDAACAGGHCTDGVCCGVAAADCGGCYACNVAGSEGTCAPVPSGEDPDAVCDGICEDGCNGAGACRPAPSDTICDPAVSCENYSSGRRQWTSTSSTVHRCGGSTECQAITLPCPSFLTCDTTAGACRTTCADDSHCVIGYSCNAGVCTAGGYQGTACSRDGQCQPYLYCISGACRECTSNRDCASTGGGLRETCGSAGDCDRCTYNNGTCAGFGPSCWASAGGCFGCTSNGDCSFDTAPNCMPTNDPTLPPGSSVCTCGASPCNAWQTCVSGECKARSGMTCLDASECASGSCVDNRCT